MSNPTPDPSQPEPKLSPFKLTTSRIILLCFGALMLVYIIAAFSGSLTNYQVVKEGAAAQATQQAAPAAK